MRIRSVSSALNKCPSLQTLAFDTQPKWPVGRSGQRNSDDWLASSVSFGKKLGANLKQSVGFFMGCVGWQPYACKGMQGYRQCFSSSLPFFF